MEAMDPSQLNEYEAYIKKVIKDEQRQQQRQQELTEALHQKEKQLERLRAKHNSLAVNNGRLAERNHRHRGQLQEAHNLQVKKSQEGAKVLEDQLAGIMTKCDALEVVVDQYGVQLEGIEAKAMANEDDLSSFNTKIEAENQRLSRARELFALQKEDADASCRDLKSALEQKSDLQDKRCEIETECESEVSKIEELQKQLPQMKARLKEADVVLKENALMHEEDVCNLIMRKLQLEDEMKSQDKSDQGQQFPSLVVASQDELNNLHEQLKSTEMELESAYNNKQSIQLITEEWKSYASSLEIQIQSKEQETEWLQQQTQLLQETYNVRLEARERRKTDNAKRLEELNESMSNLNVNKKEVEGTMNDYKARVTAKELEIKTLKEKMAVEKAEHDGLLSKRTNLQSQVEKETALLDQLDVQLSNSTERNQLLKAKVDDLSSKVEQSKSASIRKQQEAVELEQEEIALKDKLKQVQDKNTQMLQKLSTMTSVPVTTESVDQVVEQLKQKQQKPKEQPRVQPQTQVPSPPKLSSPIYSTTKQSIVDKASPTSITSISVETPSHVALNKPSKRSVSRTTSSSKEKKPVRKKKTTSKKVSPSALVRKNPTSRKASWFRNGGFSFG